MPRNSFPLFQSHLDLAHEYWKRLLQSGDIAVDATCGNGQDTLALAKMYLTPREGNIYAFDIQERAIASTQLLLADALPEEIRKRIVLTCASHEHFPFSIAPESVRLFVYNLGYLPKGDKSLTTRVESTLSSIQEALKLLACGGAISVTCYPGHTEGAEEEKSLLSFAKTLDARHWSCCHHRWLNRRESPSLLFIQKHV